MADNGSDISEANTRGADWEVVSLTASTYAAASGSQGIDQTVQQKEEEFNKNEHECSEAMFMSKHFVFAAHEPEKLPAENYCGEIHSESIHDEKMTEPQKSSQDKCKIEARDDPHKSQLFGMGCSLSDNSMNLGDGKQEEGPKMVGKEHDLSVSPNYSSFDDEANVSLADFAVPRNPSEEKLDYPSCREHGCQPNEENKNEIFDDDSPESWWKKRAMSVYSQAKGTNTIWSIFVAVAVAGLVFLGQRWRRERSQFQPFKWKFIGADEKINRIDGPVSRFKFLAGGNHRGGSMREGLHPTF